MAKSSKKTASFEENFARIEGLVMNLEQAGLPLDQALSCYEEGIRLIKECQKALSEAEQKIVILNENRHEK